MKKLYISIIALFSFSFINAQQTYTYNLLEARTYVANSGFNADTPIHGLWDGSTASGVNSSAAISGVEAWVEFNFGEEEQINEARLFQDHAGNRVTHWKVARWNGETWEDIFPYQQCNAAGWQSKTFVSSAQRIRFYAKCTASGNFVSIHEIELYSKPSTEQRKTLIGCVGDSNTAGSGASDKGFTTYPAQLGALLGGAYQVKNFGESGATMMLAADKPWTGTSKYQLHKNFNSNISLIALGTNDSKTINWNTASAANFRNDYINLITEFQHYASRPEVIMIMPIKAFPTTSYTISNTNIVNEIRPIIREISNTYGIALIDGYTLTENLEHLYTDKIHLNDEGLGVWAAKIAESLQTPKPVITINGTPSTRTFAECRWYKNGVLIEGATNAACLLNEIGTYKVAVKLNATTDDVIVSDDIVIDELLRCECYLVVSDNDISAAPNTNVGVIKIYVSGEKLIVENAENQHFALYDICGKKVFEQTLNAQLSTLNSQFPNGLYIYSIGGVRGKILL